MTIGSIIGFIMGETIGVKKFFNRNFGKLCFISTDPVIAAESFGVNDLVDIVVCSVVKF